MIQYNNILLINPWTIDVYPPPAIGYLQGAIKGHFGNDVNVTACNLESLDNILSQKEFDLVAVSFHSFSVKYAISIRNKIKKAKLICGGHHPSALPQQMLDIGYDQIVVGEGENAIIDIINGEESIIYSTNYTHYKTIDEIPFPDYTGLGDYKELAIISSRGCSFSCSYCASSLFWNRKWKMRNVPNIIEEVKLRIGQGITTWMFDDDNFMNSKKRATEFCNAIIENGINMIWEATARAETLQDEELCKLLYKAGCRVAWFGIESLSQDTLDRCNKHTTVEAMLRGIETAERNGISSVCLFLVGLPGETIDNVNETVENIKKSSIRRLGTNVAWILPNTEIHKKALEFGFDNNIFLQSGAPYYTYEQSGNTLSEWSAMIQNAIR